MIKLSIPTISRLSEQEALAVLCRLRWPETDGGPVCPKCQETGAYEISRRSIWRCCRCRHEFSITSGTLISSRKMALKDILLGVALYSGAAKGISACAMSRYLGVNYHTSFVFAHKLREALQRNDLVLDGVIEVDGCTIGGHRIATNILSPRQEIGRQAERVRRYRKNFAHRRVVVGIRQKHNAGMDGPGLTRCFIVRKESEAVDQVCMAVADGAVIHADMAHAWSSMKKLYTLLQVNHSQEAYVSNKGVHTNNIESFWSLLRKMHHGVHHRIDGENLGLYANELAWRQDNRRLSEHDRIEAILRLVLNTKPSPRWTGYSSGPRRVKAAKRMVELPVQPANDCVSVDRSTGKGFLSAVRHANKSPTKEIKAKPKKEPLEKLVKVRQQTPLVVKCMRKKRWVRPFIEETYITLDSLGNSLPICRNMLAMYTPVPEKNSKKNLVKIEKTEDMAEIFRWATSVLPADIRNLGVRMDAAQDMTCAIIFGEMGKAEVKKKVHSFINRQCICSEKGVLSLDALIGEDCNLYDKIGVAEESFFEEEEAA